MLYCLCDILGSVLPKVLLTGIIIYMAEIIENELEKPKKFFTLFTIVNVFVFLLVIFASVYFLYFKKNFQFMVETSCDKDREQCFERDCTNPDDCPPNGLTSFKRYSIKASDFKYCGNEDCTVACETQLIKCAEIKCIKDSETGWEELCFK